MDVQSTVGLVGSRAGGGPALSAEYHASLEASTAKHFPGNTLLNCMCHSTEDLYRCVHGVAAGWLAAHLAAAVSALELVG